MDNKNTHPTNLLIIFLLQDTQKTDIIPLRVEATKNTRKKSTKIHNFHRKKFTELIKFFALKN